MAQSLQWDETEKTIKATVSQKSFETEFAFTNISGNPTEITAIKVSCGCMKTELSKKTYAPGESGKLRVKFTIGTLRGTHEKELIVLSSDSAPTVLKLTADIQDTVKKNKDMLTWGIGDPLESQSFEITLPDGKSTKINDVMALGGNFDAKLAEVEAGKTYRVIVTPLKTDVPEKGSIRLEVADPTPRAIYLPVAVQW